MLRQPQHDNQTDSTRLTRRLRPPKPPREGTWPTRERPRGSVALRYGAVGRPAPNQAATGGLRFALEKGGWGSMISETMFTGTYTAMVTPFTTDGKVDEARLRQLVEQQIAAGID